jgi:glucose-1-phosphate thymidylyltransferase
MKVIILAAGYGTRLQKDVENNDTYKHLRGLPKPLLPLNSKPLINYWLDSLLLLPNSVINYPKDVYIVTNDFFHKQFIQWCEQYNFPKENVLNDGTTSNEDRLGAIADIQFAISHFSLDTDDLMIIGGDTLFNYDFHQKRIPQIIQDEFISKQDKSPVVLYYTLDSSVNISEKGILEVEKLDDKRGVVTKFLEKPQPNETNSRLACPCFYILDAPSVPLVNVFLDQVKSDTKLRDAPGHFVRYLTQQRKVIGYEIEERFDVGHLQEYSHADDYFSKTSA